MVEHLFLLITASRDIKTKNNRDFAVTDKVANQRINCINPVHGDIVAASYDQDIFNTAIFSFEDVAIPELEPQLIDNLIHDINRAVLQSMEKER